MESGDQESGCGGKTADSHRRVASGTGHLLQLLSTAREIQQQPLAWGANSKTFSSTGFLLTKNLDIQTIFLLYYMYQNYGTENSNYAVLYLFEVCVKLEN